jgi:hypothetical protein
MNPNPLESLNHFTLPVAMETHSSSNWASKGLLWSLPGPIRVDLGHPKLLTRLHAPYTRKLIRVATPELTDRSGERFLGNPPVPANEQGKKISPAVKLKTGE